MNTMVDVLHMAREIGEFGVELNHLGEIEINFKDGRKTSGNVNDLDDLALKLKRLKDDSVISIYEISRSLSTILKYVDKDNLIGMMDEVHSLGCRVKATIEHYEKLDKMEKMEGKNYAK